jgi:hypothetical protein
VIAGRVLSATIDQSGIQLCAIPMASSIINAPMHTMAGTAYQQRKTVFALNEDHCAAAAAAARSSALFHTVKTA